MPVILTYLLAFALVADAIFVAALVILRRRGVYLRLRSKFGPIMVFDSTDDDGVPVRLLNVGGKFQSVGYVDEGLRYELACVYHRYFAEILSIAANPGSVAERAAGRGAPERGTTGRDGTGCDVAHDAGSDNAGSDNAGQNLGQERPWSGDALVIGGGGYSFPKWLVAHCPQARVTVVEIDPVISDIARRRFFLDDLIRDFGATPGDAHATPSDTSPGRLRLVCDDGWAYLRGCGRHFDLIVNDAFGGRKPLGPLKTSEGARGVREHLSKHGIYLANVISALEGKRARPLEESLAACKGTFAHVYLIPERPEEPEREGDNVLIASQLRLSIQKCYAVQ